MKRALAVLALATTLLAACGEDVKEGSILKKEHREAYSYVTMQCISYGKYGCISYMPHVWHVPERWMLLLQRNGKDGPMGWVEVDHVTFDDVYEGEWYP